MILSFKFKYLLPFKAEQQQKSMAIMPTSEPRCEHCKQEPPQFRVGTSHNAPLTLAHFSTPRRQGEANEE